MSVTFEHFADCDWRRAVCTCPLAPGKTATEIAKEASRRGGEARAAGVAPLPAPAATSLPVVDLMVAALLGQAESRGQTIDAGTEEWARHRVNLVIEGGPDATHPEDCIVDCMARYCEDAGITMKGTAPAASEQLAARGGEEPGNG